MEHRVDIVSDTHGHLSGELLAALEGAELIVHAGDFTSERDFAALGAIAPMKAVKGNNDHFYNYGPDVGRFCEFRFEGLRWSVSHYREDLSLATCDVAVCGHTHRPYVERVGRCVVVNPGSPTYPRSAQGPTIARMFVEDGAVVSAKIIQL